MSHTPMQVNPTREGATCASRSASSTADAVAIPEELRPLIVPRSVPDRLEGTSKQVEYAAAVRKSMLAVARQYHPQLVDLLMCIRDATWFLGNKDRPLDRLRWPSPRQLAPASSHPTDMEMAAC